MLTMMRFADELADLADFHFPAERHQARGAQDRSAAGRQPAATWDPAKYADEYRDNLMRVIQAKLKGRKPRLKAARNAAAGRSRRPDGPAEGRQGRGLKPPPGRRKHKAASPPAGRHRRRRQRRPRRMIA